MWIGSEKGDILVVAFLFAGILMAAVNDSCVE